MQSLTPRKSKDRKVGTLDKAEAPQSLPSPMLSLPMSLMTNGKGHRSATPPALVARVPCDPNGTGHAV